MEKKIGQIIEERVKSMNMDVTEFAKRINRERSTIYHIFERSKIDTELLKKIGQVLEYDFFLHFLEPETIEKIKIANIVRKSKVFIEIPLSEDEIVQLRLEEKVLQVVAKGYSDVNRAAEPNIEYKNKKKK